MVNELPWRQPSIPQLIRTITRLWCHLTSQENTQRKKTHSHFYSRVKDMCSYHTSQLVKYPHVLLNHPKALCISATSERRIGWRPAIGSYHRRRSYFFRLYLLHQEIKARSSEFPKVIIKVQNKRRVQVLRKPPINSFTRALRWLGCIFEEHINPALNV